MHRSYQALVRRQRSSLIGDSNTAAQINDDSSDVVGDDVESDDADRRAHSEEAYDQDGIHGDRDGDHDRNGGRDSDGDMAGAMADETPLEGALADQVTAAALDAFPGATIERVETDAHGAAYEAHLIDDGDNQLVAVSRIRSDQHS